jgi:exopolysaccharide biosynthesis polyprenyl glycosylphosphotransferase
LTVRLIFVSIQVFRIQNGYDFFNTLLIGSPDTIIEFEKELNSLPKKIGNKIVAIILNQSELIVNKHLLDNKLISSVEEVDLIIKNKQIEETILLDNNLKNNTIQYLIAKCSGLGVNVKIKASDQDIALGSIKQNNLFGLLIKEIQFDPLPFWQKSIKRIIDIIISLISLLFLTPFFILIALIIKRTSKGPVFFSQERIGKHGHPFYIIKFRTMYVNSEKNGPQLSSANDNRITRFGKFLRKTRIDEFPQFINVIKGEMSLVGPRPERQFYIDKIAEKEPSFLQLTLIKPGITSWGQVKYGYAENVEEMIQRMRFDLLYLKNRTLALDFKIMFYTLITILKAKGK